MFKKRLTDVLFKVLSTAAHLPLSLTVFGRHTTKKPMDTFVHLFTAFEALAFQVEARLVNKVCAIKLSNHMLCDTVCVASFAVPAKLSQYLNVTVSCLLTFGFLARHNIWRIS